MGLERSFSHRVGDEPLQIIHCPSIYNNMKENNIVRKDSRYYGKLKLVSKNSNKYNGLGGGNNPVMANH